ncbi:hypothetical protein Y1Q_0017998 [Alligator mississippiensis]|uniref:Uncharacterized protein n=1 Tax=Alligator mississippiensis TaxID=8496 RepID=A0A151MY73_ALLMI|nr:hypothetical protein Y1Q_0017998 [Alligator mississippiensis]
MDFKSLKKELPHKKTPKDFKLFKKKISTIILLADEDTVEEKGNTRDDSLSTASLNSASKHGSMTRKTSQIKSCQNFEKRQN